MIPEHIKQLLENSSNMIKVMNDSLDTFGKVLDETIEKAPESDKAEIDRFKRLSIEVINKAKKGDTTGVEQLINSFKDGSKSNK